MKRSQWLVFELLQTIMCYVAPYLLVHSIFNQPSSLQGNPGAACTCVRAGYSILSAALASGPDIAQHVERIVKCWTRTTKCIVDGTKHFSPAHDIICLEAAVSSVVSFLRFCSEFLLSMSG